MNQDIENKNQQDKIIDTLEGNGPINSSIPSFNANFSDSVRGRLRTRRKKLDIHEPILETNLNGNKKIKGLPAVSIKQTEFDTDHKLNPISKSRSMSKSPK